MLDYLTKHGFIVCHIYRDWYLVRLYANKKHPLYHIVFPMIIKDKTNESRNFAGLPHVKDSKGRNFRILIAT